VIWSRSIALKSTVIVAVATGCCSGAVGATVGVSVGLGVAVDVSVGASVLVGAGAGEEVGGMGVGDSVGRGVRVAVGSCTAIDDAVAANVGVAVCSATTTSASGRSAQPTNMDEESMNSNKIRFMEMAPTSTWRDRERHERILTRVTMFRKARRKQF
jgi:hypothetical protein